MERIVSNPWDCLDNGALREDTSIRLHKGGRESTGTSLDGLILDQVLEALSDYADDLMHCQGRIVPSDSVAGMMKHESKLTKSDGPVRSCLQRRLRAKRQMLSQSSVVCFQRVGMG